MFGSQQTMYRFDFRKCTGCGRIDEDVPREDIRLPQVTHSYTCFPCQQVIASTHPDKNDLFAARLDRIASAIELLAEHLDPDRPAKMQAKADFERQAKMAGALIRQEFEEGQRKRAEKVADANGASPEQFARWLFHRDPPSFSD